MIVKARFALFVAIVLAISGTLAVALVRVLSPNDKPSVPVVLPAPPIAAPKAPADDQTHSGPNFSISKETTYITGPLDKDGYVNYMAALNERSGKGVTLDNNANVLIWMALGPKPDGGKAMPAEFFKLMDMVEPPEKGEYFVDFERFLREHRKIAEDDRIEAMKNQLSQAVRYPWTAKDYPDIAAWLIANEKPLALVAEGANRPHYFSPLAPTGGGILGVRMPGVSKSRAAANALAARAMRRVQDGKLDEAWRDLLACHRLGRHIGRGATFIEVLAGMGISVIAQRANLVLLDRPDVDVKRLRGFQRDLQALPAFPPMADRLDAGERFQILENVMFTDALGFWYVEAGLVGTASDKIRVPKGRLTNINWDPGLRRINQWFDRLVAAAREPDRAAREKEFERIEVELEKEKFKKPRGELELELNKAVLDVDITPEARGDVFSHMVFFLVRIPARKVSQAYDRQEQGERNLHVAFALAAYHSDHRNYPKSLDALVPKYLAKAPNDLFTGKPLIYRPSANGYLLYSLGPDGKDNEGRGNDDKPKGDDISVRIPVPKPAKQ
jgi:hypothetical protein